MLGTSKFATHTKQIWLYNKHIDSKEQAMKKWKPLSQKRADNRLLKELKRERNKANTEAAKKKEQPK
jgi:hypothetical protein